MNEEWGESEVLVVHAPNNDKNRHLIREFRTHVLNDYIGLITECTLILYKAFRLYWCVERARKRFTEKMSPRLIEYHFRRTSTMLCIPKIFFIWIYNKSTNKIRWASKTQKDGGRFTSLFFVVVVVVVVGELVRKCFCCWSHRVTG